MRDFIVENFLFGDTANMGADDTFFMDTGTIDSTGILEIIGFLEDEHNITIGDSELLPENLDSLNAIAAFVNHKKQENS